MMGCTAACTYKMHPLVFGSSPSSILSMADELSATMVDEANKLDIVRGHSRKRTLPEVFVQENHSSISTPTIINSQHTQNWLKNGKQVRCVWCSRINFTVRKTTLLCIECNKGFCRDTSGRSCWLHHVAHGGYPVTPARGSIQANMKKKKDMDE